MTVPPDRPILRYPGGKWRLAPWIISHFPVHQVYVEPFCGGASVLLRKPRSKFSEVINDLDADVVNLFRVLRSDMASELIRQVELTPFARDEFDEAHEDLEASPLERARQFLIKSHMGQSSWFFYEKNGFRSKRSMEQSPSHEWQRFPAHMRKVVKRLQGVVIESRPALEILERYDGPNVLFYVDPPYLHSVRTSRINTGSKKYRHELTDDDHVELAEALHKLQGNAIVSGYRCPLYEDLYQGWTMDQRRSMADRAVERTECIWMSPGVTLQGRLFEEAM